MAKAKRYMMEQIEGARKKLRCLSAKKVGKTRTEAAGLLAGDIRKAVQQGYSLQEIKDVLVQSGIPVSLARMRALLECPDESGEQIEKETEGDTALSIEMGDGVAGNGGSPVHDEKNEEVQ
ncbi:hypothetical protein [uncultured Desulfovibrio sp.]|uniref:hypothetical protein n=1 Tax=uncultured Desulfovibrio sp. TaxID=167968 RepID=UPI002595C249|nr:hypothetical protein [uncultured Desulfovibrio sp.]